MHLQIIIIFQKHLISNTSLNTFADDTSPPIQNQFSLLLCKRHQKLGRDQHELIPLLILLYGLHHQPVKVQT